MSETLSIKISRFDQKLDDVKNSLNELKDKIDIMHNALYIDGEVHSVATRLTLIESDLYILNTSKKEIKHYAYASLGFLFTTIIIVLGWLVTSGYAGQILNNKQ